MKQLVDSLNNILKQGNNAEINIEIFYSLADYITIYTLDKKDKYLLIRLFLEITLCCINIEKNIHLLPPTLENIYYSNLNFKNIILLFEDIDTIDVPSKVGYEQVVNLYIDFLEDSNNFNFVTYNFPIIKKYNRKLLDYLDKRDYNDNRFEDAIDPNVIYNLKKAIVYKNLNR